MQNNHPLASVEDQPHIPRCFVNPDTQLWYTLMVRRHEFDESLREIAAKKGVHIIHGAVRELGIVAEDDKQKSTVSFLEIEPLNGQPYKINAKFVIDATGQQAFIPRKLKARHIVDDWNLQARYTYLQDVNFDNAIKNGLFKEGANIISFEDGWAWIANLGRNMTSVGIVSKYWNKTDKNFWAKLENLPEYKIFGFDKATTIDHMGDVTESDNFYAHPNYRFRSETMRGRNWACVGDAAMFLDPLLSQGVTLGVSFGSQLGKLAHLITTEDVVATEVLNKYENSYISEIEVLNKVVTQWYQPEFKFDKNWTGAAQRISSIFGRKIGTDVESFRWVSNLENIHHIIHDKNDHEFLKQLDSVNSIKMIHDFEKYNIISV